MTITDLLIVTLAAGALVEIYRHSSLTRPVRDFLDGQEDPGPRLRPFVRLSRCGFCLSFWGAAAASGLILVHESGFGRPWSWAGYFLAVALAGMRAANLVNDLTHHRSRSPHVEGRHFIEVRGDLPLDSDSNQEQSDDRHND